MTGYSPWVVAAVLAIFFGGGALMTLLGNFAFGVVITAREIDRDPTA
jgi:hypothetical protein